MGRDFLSATELVHQVIDDLRHFAEALPTQDRLIFDKFTEYTLNNRAALANAASLVPLEAVLLILLLEEHKRTQRLYDELYAEIERLKRATEQLNTLALTEESR